MFEVAMKYLNDTGKKTLVHLVRQKPTPATYVAEVDGNMLAKSNDELLELAHEVMYADLFAKKQQAEHIQKLEDVSRQLKDTIETVKRNQKLTDDAIMELTQHIFGMEER